MDLSFGTILVLLILFFTVQWFARAIASERQSRKNQIVNYLNSIIHQVNVENHYGVEYWFDQHNNKFLGQGKSFDDVVNVLKSRFPEHIFMIENRGVFCAKTNWQIVPFDELTNIDLLSSERNQHVN